LFLNTGGRKKLDQKRNGERELGDERILGSGSFVEEVLKAQKREATRSTSHDFEGILEETCKKFRVSREQILNGSRARDISRARRVFFLRAHEEAGQSFSGLGRLCGFSHTSVREAITKARIEEREK
jgi:chromosomal replication initiation ATPase DnaA